MNNTTTTLVFISTYHDNVQIIFLETFIGATNATNDAARQQHMKNSYQ